MIQGSLDYSEIRHQNYERHSADGGYTVRMTNKSTTTIPFGYIVRTFTTSDFSIKLVGLTATLRLQPIGVTCEIINPNVSGRIAVAGFAYVKAATTAIVRGGVICASSGSNGMAKVLIAGAPPFNTSHMMEIGYAVTACAAGAYCAVILHLN